MPADLLHPKIVHLPMALAVLMPLLMGGLWLAWWRDWLPRRAWWIAVALQAVLVGSSFVAMETGEDEEDRVEAIVPHDAIEAHEEAAEVFLWASGALLLLVLGAGLLPKDRVALGLAGVATLGAVGTLALGVDVGSHGGELVYVHNAGAAYATDAPPAEGRAYGEHDEDDDDD